MESSGHNPFGAGWRPEPSDGGAEPTPPDAAAPREFGARPTEPSPRSSSSDTGRIGSRPWSSPRRADDTITGSARDVAQRLEEGEQVWTLRLERYDDEGNRLQPVPVELRGRQLAGSISDGDLVRAAGRWRDGTLVTKELGNLTTGGSLRRRWGRGETVVAAVVVVIGLGVTVLASLVLFEVFNHLFFR